MRGTDCLATDGHLGNRYKTTWRQLLPGCNDPATLRGYREIGLCVGTRPEDGAVSNLARSSPDPTDGGGGPCIDAHVADPKLGADANPRGERVLTSRIGSLLRERCLPKSVRLVSVSHRPSEMLRIAS